MNFFQFVRILKAWWVIIAVCVVSALMAALIAIKLMPTQYEANSRILLDLLEPDAVTGKTLSSGNTRGYVKTQIELIRDYRVAGRVVDNLRWAESPFYLERYQNRGANDDSDFRRWAAETVIERTNVAWLDASNILEIRYRSTTPQSEQTIADAVRDAYVEQSLEFKREAARENAAWFSEQAAEVRDELSKAEKALNDFERANNVVLTTDSSDTEEDRLRALAATPPTPVIAAPAVAAPAATSPLQGQLAALDAQIATAAGTLGPNHPQLVALKQQRASLASAVAADNARLRAASRVAPAPTGPSAAAQLSAQQQRVLAKRGLVNEAQKLALNVTVLRSQFETTSQRAADFEQQAATTDAGATLLGNAVTPTSPSSPKIPLILIGAFGFGLGLGIVASLIVELLRRKVRGPEDLRIEGVPILGMMGRDLPGKGDAADRKWYWPFRTSKSDPDYGYS